MCGAMSDKLTLRSGNSGIVFGVPYHDGIISALHIEADFAKLRIRKNEELYEVAMNQVIDYNLTDVWMNSIVNAIRQWPLLSAPAKSDDDSFGLAHLYRNRTSDSDMEIILSRAMVKLPDAKLTQVDCSYGGVLSFVCSSVTAVRLR